MRRLIITWITFWFSEDTLLPLKACLTEYIQYANKAEFLYCVTQLGIS